MSTLLIPADAADVVRTALDAVGMAAGATPVPPDFTSSLPFVCIRTTGGRRESVALDSHSMRVDAWGATWAEANATARTAAAVVAGMDGHEVAGTSVCRVSVGMPYDDPDPDHQTVPRVSFTVSALMRPHRQPSIPR